MEILSATYFNTGDPKPYPEAAIKIDKGKTLHPDKAADEKYYVHNNSNCLNPCNTGIYIGDYLSTWIEGNDHVKMTLIIRNTAGSYQLFWQDQAHSKRFE